MKEIAKDVHGFKIGLRVGVAILSAVFAGSTAIIVFVLNHFAEAMQAFFTTTTHK